jgi:hypothetical protein
VLASARAIRGIQIDCRQVSFRAFKELSARRSCLLHATATHCDQMLHVEYATHEVLVLALRSNGPTQEDEAHLHSYRTHPALAAV